MLEMFELARRGRVLRPLGLEMICMMICLCCHSTLCGLCVDLISTEGANKKTASQENLKGLERDISFCLHVFRSAFDGHPLRA